MYSNLAFVSQFESVTSSCQVLLDPLLRIVSECGQNSILNVPQPGQGRAIKYTTPASMVYPVTGLLTGPVERLIVAHYGYKSSLRSQIFYTSIYPLIQNFLTKCPFSSVKKRHFARPNLRTDSKNFAKHPPKWRGRHLFHAFSPLWWVLSQFFLFNRVFRATLSQFTLLKRAKK